jgi:hypothetical protein
MFVHLPVNIKKDIFRGKPILPIKIIIKILYKNNIDY